MINPEFLAKVATDALLQEVNLAPKPGLVDPISVGAHKDMTKETFYQSIEALRPYLLAYAEAGSRRLIQRASRPWKTCRSRDDGRN